MLPAAVIGTKVAVVSAPDMYLPISGKLAKTQEVAEMLHIREGESTAMFIVRWAARLFSLATALLLALFFLGEGLQVSDLAGFGFVGLLFFPVGLLVGFAVGWRNELAGGIISVLSIAAFYFAYELWVNGTLPSGFSFALFAVPGLLFLAYGIIDRVVLHHHRPNRMAF